MQSQPLRKVLKFASSAGLAVILLLMTLAYLVMRKKNGYSLINRAVIWVSKYRSLLPYIIAQSKFETANLTSNVYKVNNNMFGMKVPTKRNWLGTVGTPAPDGGNYSAYNSDTTSLRDLFVYFDYVDFPTRVGSVEQYADELVKRHYGPSKDSIVRNMNFWLS